LPLAQEKRYTYADVLAWDDDTRYELYDGKPVALFVNGVEKASGVASADAGVKYDPFQFNASADADENGVVTVAEKGGYELWIDGVKLDGSFDTGADQVIPNTYEGVTFMFGYDSESIYMAQADVETADAATAVVEGAKKTTLNLSNATAANGKIEISTKAEFEETYTLVTFARGAEIASFDLVDGKEEESAVGVDTTDNVGMYIKSGSTMYVTTSNIRFTSAPSLETDVMTATVGTTETKVRTSKWVGNGGNYTAVFEYEIPTSAVTIAMSLTNAAS